jgi:hypothetical protein
MRRGLDGLSAIVQQSLGHSPCTGSALLNGLDPAAWLKDILEKLSTWPNRRIDELLPWGAID